jgi:hypothetical protein
VSGASKSLARALQLAHAWLLARKEFGFYALGGSLLGLLSVVCDDALLKSLQWLCSRNRTLT